MAKRQETDQPTSQRHLRIGESIRHALAQILASGRLRDPALFDVSVTVAEARVTPDLRNVTVYVMPLAGRAPDEVVDALNRSSPWLRGEITRAVGLKFAPKMRFELDRTFDESDKVTALLSDPRVAQDLARPVPKRPRRRKA